MKLFGLALNAVAFAQLEILEYKDNNSARWGKQMTGPMCFKCEGNSWKECREQAWAREGGPVSCREDKVCSMVERRRGGKIYRVESRCKQVDVCLMERWHNLRPCPQMPSATECNRMERDQNGAETTSICRNCFEAPEHFDEQEAFMNKIDAAEAQNGLPLSEWMKDSFYEGST